jgi:hypothetical protein
VTGLSKNIVIRPGPAKLVLTGFAPRVQIRQYVTMGHLWTARHAAAGAKPLRLVAPQPPVPQVSITANSQTGVVSANHLPKPMRPHYH